MSTTELLGPIVDLSVVQVVPEDALYEVVNGHRVEKPPMSTLAVQLAFELARRVGNHAEQAQSGRAATEQLFLLDADRQLQRRPDAAYVSFDRWPANRPIPLETPWPVVPNMATEVISPSNLAQDVNDKIWEYLRAGVQLVWVVYPNTQQVYVYESPDRVRVLLAHGELDGGTVLPGFRLPLATLFGAVAPAVS